MAGQHTPRTAGTRRGKEETSTYTSSLELPLWEEREEVLALGRLGAAVAFMGGNEGGDIRTLAKAIEPHSIRLLSRRKTGAKDRAELE